jgi:cyclopropane-fatty-acyl-phospholipid synthase
MTWNADTDETFIHGSEGQAPTNNHRQARPISRLCGANMYLFGRFMRALLRRGSLRVIDADGNEFRFGSDEQTEDNVAIRLHRRSLPWKLALRPGLYLGEAYMAGDLTLERGDIYDLLALCGKNLASAQGGKRRPFRHLALRIFHRLSQWNSLARSRKNVAHHYDLAGDLYRSFLDQDLQYSCAYFPLPGTTLDVAQAAKRRHIVAKLLLQPNQRVLDIGSGWGGLAIEIAKNADVRVDGVTLSKEQLQVARDRAAGAGVSHNVHFALKDYREIAQTYERIVSVGMFEHVGAPYYRAFFRKVADMLAPGGIALIHSIGSLDGPGFGNAFMRKYIFPGGYIPALSEVTPAVEDSGLVMTDIEILRLHYAETLRHWRERFLNNWDTIKHLYDERFKRMWEFYLAGCEMSFRYGGLMVFQLQLGKDLEAVPLTRDYIYEREHCSDVPKQVHEQAA